MRRAGLPFLAAIGCGIVLSGCGGQSSSAPSAVTTTAKPRPQTLAQVIKQVRSGVIRIEAATCDGSAVGSGFLVSPHLVATVEHVVHGATKIVLKRDGVKLGTATVIGRDAARDLALLQTS